MDEGEESRRNIGPNVWGRGELGELGSEGISVRRVLDRGSCSVGEDDFVPTAYECMQARRDGVGCEHLNDVEVWV